MYAHNAIWHVCAILTAAFTLSNYVKADIIAYDRFNGSMAFQDMEAEFGPGVADGGMLGVLVRADPYDACQKMKPPPFVPADSGGANITLSSYALITRGTCDFGLKVLNAQKAGFLAAIVHNVDSDLLVRMSTKSPAIAKEIRIPAVFIGQNSAIILNSSYLYDKDGHPYIQLFEGSFNPLEYYLVPFIIVITVCFVSLLCFLLVKCIRDRRRARRGRLSLQRLKKLPVKKFEKGDEYDVCAICLEDYEEGDTLRILPCRHAYHCKCVDPWLTSSKRICPLCKRRVLSDDESSSSSEEDGDSSDDERTSLTARMPASSANAASYATGFANRNPLVRAHDRNASITSDTSGDTTVTDVSEDETTARLLPVRRHRRVRSPAARRAVVVVDENLAHSSGYQSQPLASVPGVAVPASPEVVTGCVNPALGSNDLIDSAEAYLNNANRVSESSITVLSDVETLGSTPEHHSESSVDFHSFDENSIVLHTPPQLDVDHGHINDAHDSDHDDIVVIASGSRVRANDDTSEV